jgi:hypothetical protein
MVRSIIAIAAGYLTLAILVGILVMTLGIMVPTAIPNNETIPSLGWVFFIEIFSLLAAAAGGYLTAFVARGSRISHVQLLGAVVLLVGLIQIWAGMNKLPIWYLVLQVAVSLVGVFLGGGLLTRHMPTSGSSHS